jgi:hypothetical protein
VGQRGLFLLKLGPGHHGGDGSGVSLTCRVSDGP